MLSFRERWSSSAEELIGPTVSVHAPVQGAAEHQAEYDQTSCARETGWGVMVKRYGA